MVELQVDKLSFIAYSAKAHNGQEAIVCFYQETLWRLSKVLTMCCDKNSDKYNKSTEPFFSDTSITKKGLLIYCDLMADLSLFPP